MTSQLLASELANLIQESKRKHNDLRQAAEKSLEELKNLRASSEAQIADGLSQRPAFVNPFIIACGTRNVKFTGIAIVCLQRLIVVRALPRARLSQVLEALQQATSAGLDVQLKILQALPALLSNYADDVRGELLVTALNVCFILQSSKNAIVNHTSAATLQQLVVSVFDKVVAEDKSDVPPVGEVPLSDGPIPLRPAAMDAYRIFNDICLLTEVKRPEYLRFSGLPQTFGLELIESVLTNHSAIFISHREQSHILQSRVMPFLIAALRSKANFATSVRLVRVLYTLLRRHLPILPAESADALDILTQLLDQDTTLWRRALCMEVFRGIFADPPLLRRIFMLYDAQEGQKNILKNLAATFVRVSTEKPSVIGLGHQSTIPVANPYSASATNDQVMLEAGVTGIISGSVTSDAHNTGISTHWSTMRVPCIDQLDKTDAPGVPESYVYSLTLACITSLSEGLAKFILPLTVPSDGRRKRTKQEPGRDSPAPQPEEGLERTQSFKKNPVPVNPLTLDSHPLFPEVKVCAAIIEECWPAILATCSTFLYAALDSEYYHGLVRAFQKFAHVAGLLQLTTPRDAFLTTLGKAAVPPNVLSACLNAGPRPAGTATTPTESTAVSLLSNARGLLSVDNLVSPTSEKPRQQSMDVSAGCLNTRNLLCLRALLNLGIALGPTLEPSSWGIVLETLQQADYVMYASGRAAGRTPLAAKGPDPIAEQEASTLLNGFAGEVRAVETAAQRLFESTVDWPNGEFVSFVNAVCDLLDRKPERDGTGSRAHSPPPTPVMRTPTTPTVPHAGGGGGHKRVMSISSATTTSNAAATAASTQENQFALAKLGDLASINLERLLTYDPSESGFAPLVDELISVLAHPAHALQVRARAAETLVRVLLEQAQAVTSQGEDVRGVIQGRVVGALGDAVAALLNPNRETSGMSGVSVDVEMQRILLEGVRSLVEGVGESLVQGWEGVFGVVDSIFLESRGKGKGLGVRSGRLIRPSFAVLQLVCSDFLEALPQKCFLCLVRTVGRFCSQEEDLNVALTTVTFFWAISDFLSKRSQSMSITAGMMGGEGDESLEKLAADPTEEGSVAALWMLLLLRLTSVATDQRLELRNSAVQTLMRIMSAYGESLSPEAWSICMRSVIYSLLSSVEQELRSLDGEDKKGLDEWKETAIVVIQGVADLFSAYLGMLTAHDSFSSIWADLIGHFTALLDLHVLDINAAVFSALRDVLNRCVDHPVSQLCLDLAWKLWSRSIPAPDIQDDKSADNQKSLLVWVETLLSLYTLTPTSFPVARVQRMLSLLLESVIRATPAPYSSDIEYVTPLQGKVIEVFRVVRTDGAEVPGAVIRQVAEFVSLAFSSLDKPVDKKRTYVALAKESMGILAGLMVQHAREEAVFSGGAFAAGLRSLVTPVKLKYQFPVVPKSTAPWKVATESSLSVLEAALPFLCSAEGNEGLPRQRVQEIWEIVVALANGIVDADVSAAAPGTDIAADQEFDIAAFKRLRKLIIPSLGGEIVLEETRRAYCEGLFWRSIIHALTPAEDEMLSSKRQGETGVGLDVLAALCEPRHGRTIDPAPTHRPKVAEVCLGELFSLVSGCPETPHFSTGDSSNETGSHSTEDEESSPLRARLAKAAAPYLLIRCALTLRAYVSDQPLRGARMPQPLSQRRELAWILRKLADLRSEAGAIPDLKNVDCEGGKHLLRLYPLLVGVISVAGAAGDMGRGAWGSGNVANGYGESIGELAGRCLGKVGGEFGI